MKKQLKPQKLTLSKTTVRVLSSSALQAAAGGVVDSECGSCNGSCGVSCICSVLGCPTAGPGCIVLQ